jgi:Na+/H+-translocating membrane pyrophosphatase
MVLASSLIASWQEFPSTGFTPAGGENSSIFLWIALAIGALGLIIALLFARSVLSSDNGTVEMQSISNAIREGAEAFMGRQYTSIAIIASVLAVVLYIGYRFSPFTAPLANKVVISFLIGAICSALDGFGGADEPGEGTANCAAWRGGDGAGCGVVVAARDRAAVSGIRRADESTCCAL